MTDVRRLRLLVIASTFPAADGDGTPAFVRDLAEYEARHFTTLVLVPRVRGGATDEQVRGLSIRRFAYFPRRWERLADGAIIENLRADRSLAVQVPALLIAEARALRRAVREFRPDVIHVHWMIPQGLVALLAVRGVPRVVTTLGGDLYALRGPVFRWLKGRTVSGAAAVTTMNRDMRDRLIELGAPADRTFVLPMGADIDSVRRTGAGVQRVPGRLLFAGRLVEKKGAAVLLDAAALLPPELSWQLDVVGDGPLRGALERAATRVPGRVRFRGQQTREQLARSMHEAEVVVVPSVPAASGDQDGLPVALLEAMGAGCAIVASRIAGIDEAVEHDVSGVLVPPGDAAALAAAIADVLGDPSRAQQLRAAAACRAEEFSVESVGRRYVDLLRAAAQSR